MANTVISPNMNMPVPVVGVDPGPDWATDINACLSILDSHTHTSGQGVPITPAAININADLPMNGNNLITARSVRFSPQSGIINGASDLGCLYENGVDLYYIDGAGNQVRITQGGSVTGATGTITGLPSGTASASYSAGTFTFQGATNTPATMNVGTIVLGQLVAGGKNVTIAASGSQAANYNLTLPIALPSLQSSVISDSSGNLSFLTLRNLTYTPTVAVVSGCTGPAVPGPWMVTQIGNNIQVAGIVTFAANLTVVVVSLTLPVARTAGNFTQEWQAVGNVTQSDSSTASPSTEAGRVSADTTGSQLVIATISTSTGIVGGIAQGTMYLQFTYSLVNI